MSLLPPSTLRVALAILAVASVSHALPVQNGPASTLAAGISMTTPLGNYGERIYLTEPGIQSTPLAPWAPTPYVLANYPVYTLESMFGPTLAAEILIDAQSSGNDVIPDLDTTGIPDLQANGDWLGVVVSISGKSGYVPQSVPARLSSALGRPVESDLFGHYFENSAGLAPSVAGVTFVEQLKADMGLGAVTTSQVDGLDFAIGVQTHSQQVDQRILFIGTTKFFFSLSPSCINLNSQVWSNFAVDPATANPVPAHPAAIYEMTWIPSPQGGTWDGPFLYKSHTELGLTEVRDNIDALAVDFGSGDEKVVVFSTQLVNNRSQLLVHATSLSHPVALQGRRSGTGLAYSVAAAITGSDEIEDIDAVSLLDPESHEHAKTMGTPRFDLLASDSLGLSVTRHDVGQTTEELILHVSGWVTDTPDDETLGLWYSTQVDPVLLSQYSPYAAGPWARSSSDSTFEIRIPQATIAADELSLFVVAYNNQTSTYKTTWVCTIDSN